MEIFYHFIHQAEPRKIGGSRGRFKRGEATKKSFELRDSLSHIIPTYIEMIDKDLKWMTVGELKEWGGKL